MIAGSRLDWAPDGRPVRQWIRTPTSAKISVGLFLGLIQSATGIHVQIHVDRDIPLRPSRHPTTTTAIASTAVIFIAFLPPLVQAEAEAKSGHGRGIFFRGTTTCRLDPWKSLVY